MRKVKFNDQCVTKGTGFFHGFFDTEYGPCAVVEIIEAEGEQASKTHALQNSGGFRIPQMEVRPYEKGQIHTCHASGITFLDEPALEAKNPWTDFWNTKEGISLRDRIENHQEHLKTMFTNADEV